MGSIVYTVIHVMGSIMYTVIHVIKYEESGHLTQTPLFCVCYTALEYTAMFPVAVCFHFTSSCLCCREMLVRSTIIHSVCEEIAIKRSRTVYVLEVTVGHRFVVLILGKTTISKVQTHQAVRGNGL